MSSIGEARAASISLETVVAGMLRVTAAAALVLEPEHLRCMADHCADDTTRLLTLWEARP